MPANLLFKRGLLANLPQTTSDGTIYVTTDEHAMYLDYGTLRIRLGDFIPVNNISDLPAAGHAYETAMYYIKNGNILARWLAPIEATANSEAQPGRWIQINKAGVVGVLTTGSGNLISDITTTTAADGTLQLLVTKASVASSTDFELLSARLTALESGIDDLTTGMNPLESILDVAASVTETLLGNETTYITLKAIGDELRTLSTAVNTLNGDATVTGSVDLKVAEAIAAIVANAPSSFDTLKEIADWIATHPNDFSAINTAINNLQGRMTAVEDGLSTEITARMDADDALQTNINAVDARVDATNITVNSLSTNFSSLSLMVSDHEERLTWIDFDTTT